MDNVFSIIIKWCHWILACHLAVASCTDHRSSDIDRYCPSSHHRYISRPCESFVWCVLCMCQISGGRRHGWWFKFSAGNSNSTQGGSDLFSYTFYARLNVCAVWGHLVARIWIARTKNVVVRFRGDFPWLDFKSIWLLILNIWIIIKTMIELVC